MRIVTTLTAAAALSFAAIAPVLACSGAMPQQSVQTPLPAETQIQTAQTPIPSGALTTPTETAQTDAVRDQTVKTN